MTVVDTRPVLSDNDTDDPDRVAHYFRKEDIVRSIVSGEAIQAVCGRWVVPHRDPEKFAVCPDCKTEYERRPDTPEGK